MVSKEYVPDRGYDRRRNVANPDSLPEQHENVAQGAATMAALMRARAEEAAAQGDLLTHQTASRVAERSEQLAWYHRDQADQRRDKIAGHPASWGDEDDA